MSFKKTGDSTSIGIVNQPTQQPKPDADDKSKVAKQPESAVSK